MHFSSSELHIFHMFILSIEACYQNSTVALYNNLNVIGIFMGPYCTNERNER